jgi:glycosyltransferase involved in cell wall biosynthesis
MSLQVRANLYQPFPDPWRQSMRVYAASLSRALESLAASALQIDRIALEDPRLDPPLRYWDQYVRYQRLARRSSADVHHVLDHAYAHLASAVPERRAVVTFHDAIPMRNGRASSRTRLMLSRGMRGAAARGARFIAVSRASKDDAEALFGVPPASITVVPNGVDARFAPSLDREALRARLQVRRALVLIVGHTQPYMNVEGAIRAAASAARETDLEVVKIGAPLTVEQGRLAVAEGLGDRLRERGIVGDEELREWYAAADALVYLPVLSGFGLPVLEAMASGTPVVASSIGAVPEVAEGAALLVDPRDARAAGLALVEALAPGPAREGLIARGVARASEYPWRRTAEMTLGVYREVADGA